MGSTVLVQKSTNSYFPYSDAFMAGIRTQDVLIQSIFAPSNHDEKHISRI